jgi:hypothetical protein
MVAFGTTFVRFIFSRAAPLVGNAKMSTPTHIGLNPAAAALIGGADDLMTLEVVEASR